MKIERPVWRWAAYTHNSIKKKCGKRGWQYDLDRVWLEANAPLVCPVLGIPINYGNHKICFDSPSVDRFDNNIGYTHANTSIISARANMMKNDGTVEDALKLYIWMRDRNGNLN